MLVRKLIMKKCLLSVIVICISLEATHYMSM